MRQKEDNMSTPEKQLDNSAPVSNVLLGIPIESVNEADKLRSIAVALWQIIDDIDTASDVAKDRDIYYRNMVQEIQKKRHLFLVSDGYNLFLPPAD